MARKKGLAAFYSRRKKSSSPKKNAPIVGNPPIMNDLVDFIVPGFIGYAATRFLSRITYSLVSRRFPKLGRHAAVISSAAAFTGAYFLVHRFKKVQKYHTPVTVGAAIAAAQTAVQCYFPKYGWMVSDFYEGPKALGPAPASAAKLAARQAAVQQQIAAKSNGSGVLPTPDDDLGSLGASSNFDDSTLDEIEDELDDDGGGDIDAAEEFDNDYLGDLSIN